MKMTGKKIFLIPATVTPVGLWLRRNPFIFLFVIQQTFALSRFSARSRDTKNKSNG